MDVSTIRLCVIVRDEEDNLAQCLESACGFVNETIAVDTGSRDATPAIRHANAEIMHYGYSQHAGQRREKTLRNISILKQALVERPGDPFLSYNLGLSFYALGDLENSRHHYEAVRQHLDPGDMFTAAFFRNYAICLGDLGDFEQALNLIDEGLACFPDYPDLYFIKGEFLFDLNLMAQAKNSFLKCLRFHTLPEYVTTEGVTGHLALQNLAEVCARQQDLDEAVAYLEQVLRIRPAYELFAQLCSLMKQKGLDEGDVAKYLENSFHLDHPAIARLLLDIKDAGYGREDLQQLEGALHSGIATAGVYYLLGTACANLDRHGQAFVYFAQAGLQEPGNELYAACALEQLANQCLLHITRMLDLENGQVELRKELFRLTSLRHKAQRLKQGLLESDVRSKKPEAVRKVEEKRRWERSEWRKSKQKS
jgi:tetratricopeptide (TPR) repeat protein